MKQTLTICLAGLAIFLAGCTSGDLLTVAIQPTPIPTATFVPVRYVTAAPTPTPLPSQTPTATPTALPTDRPTLTASPPAASPVVTAAPATATVTAPPPTSTPAPPPVTPTATTPPTPAALNGRIAFPVDDGGGYYDVWVVELPDGDPFLVQRRARHPNFAADGRLLVKSQGSDLGESIGLLDASYTWQGIINESPADSFPFWAAEGQGYAYSNGNLVKDPDTAHLAPYIFTACSLQIPRFENSEKCRDFRRWGKIEVGDAPVWTADDQLAFFSYKGDDGIYLVENVSLLREAGGLAPSRLLVESNGRPTDTDGNQLFFSAGNIDGNWEAYAIDLDGANLTNLSSAPAAQDGLPTVSPGGSWVAFVSDRDGRWGIWVTPRTGGEALKVADLSSINTTLDPWGAGDRAWQMERISWGP